MKCPPQRPILPQTLPLFTEWPSNDDLYVNDKRFINEVLREADDIFALTYTCTADIANELPLSRLICSRLVGNLLPSIEVRHVANLHSKLYIVKNARLSNIWIGSMNLVHPGSLHNVMIMVDTQQALTLLHYFNRLWKQTNPTTNNELRRNT